MNRKELYKIFNKKGFKMGAEIGVQRGRNARAMFKYIPGLTLYLIDPWEKRERLYKWTMKKLSSYGDNAIVMRSTSANAAPKVPDKSLDFVYIDADHSYDAVMLDIILWIRKIKNGGIISGHDYRPWHKRGFGVKFAVDDYVKHHKIDLKINQKTNWYWKI